MTPHPPASGRLYDVAILGSGLGGSMLACILAKRGLSVLLIEADVHPRFTIGESLIPETGVRLQLLARKYDVPEIGWIGPFHDLQSKVSSNCGVKRAFSFVYHREGEPARETECNQLPTLTPPFGPDSHLFRQDTDAWLAAVSARYGADLRQGLRIDRLDFGDDGVTLKAASGEEFRCRFLVDAGGMRSLVAQVFGLRDAIPRFQTNTRALFNHFAGVRAFNHFIGRNHGMPSPLGQGTMHHIFAGGWMWVIPFNNHRRATNPLTSVGIMLDRTAFPDSSAPPADQFRDIVRRFPSVARSFESAVPIRPWVGSGRLQYSSPRMIGPRYLQLPHAAAFVDPLYSSGMSVLTVSIDLIADALLPALHENDFTEERFETLNSMVNRGFDHYDFIVSRSFKTFGNYDLWNAWNRIWVMGNFLGTFGALATLLRYLSSGDRAVLAGTTDPSRIGVLGCHLPEVVDVMRTSGNEIDAVERGEMAAAQASARIFDRLGSLPFLPPYMGFGKPEQRAQAVFTLQAGARHVLWYRYRAPQAWKERNDFPLVTYALRVLGALAGAARDGAHESWMVTRDVLSAGNGEWRAEPRVVAPINTAPEN